jgi:hypothetical protein
MARYYDFAGAQIAIPGVYTQRLFPEDEGAGGVTGRVVIMGEALRGGIPYDAEDDVENIINVIDGQAQALNVFGGGDLYYGAEFYLTPSKDDRFNRPSRALCVVVNQMGQASTELEAGSNPVIDVKFNKYGIDGNLAAVKISVGSTTGKLIEFTYKGKSLLKQDDVTLNFMSIEYTGAGTIATLTIDATTLTTAVTGGDPGDNLSITLADYSDMGSLINYINDHPSYICLLTGLSDEQTTFFDAVSGQDIKTSAYNTVGVVEAIIRALNATGRVTAILHDSAARTIPDNLSEFQYMTGGSVSSATTQDWTDALEKLEEYELNNIVCMSGSETIHNLVSDHVTRMNDIKIKRYRQAGFGSGSATNTKALRIAEMKSLNNAYIEYTINKIKRYDYVNKEVRDFEPYYFYPIVSGFRYANSVGMSVVFKGVNIDGLAETISNKDLDEYAIAGATAVSMKIDRNNDKNFEIGINNTVYQGGQVTRTNPAVVYEINVLTKDMEERILDQIRTLNRAANALDIANIQNWIVSYLLVHYRDDKKWITNGPNGQKAFDNVKFSISGEVFSISATLTMSVTPNFIFNLLTFITPGQNV